MLAGNEPSESTRVQVGDPAFWCCLLGMLLLLASTSLLNAVIFPTFDDTFTYARDISVLTNAVALIATALVAT